jgi:hypothetical protein
MKRITLNEHEAEHLYEMAYANMQLNPTCPVCGILGKKLKKFLGEKTVRSMKRTLKKNPY